MRIGIFGGTFDPPHLGHLILAAEARFQLELDRLLWVLTPIPPHKPNGPVAALRSRRALVEAAIADAADFELSPADIDRPPPHYAVDTVRILQRQHPGAELIYLMGSDSLGDLPTWHRPLEFLEACAALGVMTRPYRKPKLDALEGALPGIRSKIHLINVPLLEIKSREIRSRIAAGAPFRYYLPERVYQIIRRDGLYR